LKDTENKKKMTDCLDKDNCIPQEIKIENVRLAAAYVPYQYICTLFTPFEALRRGTAFPELYSPYKGEDKKSRPYHMEANKKERA
jgi:hypothetical protein